MKKALAVILVGAAVLLCAAPWVFADDSDLKFRYGITATASEINTLDGITATVTELNYTDGVTSALQTQLDAKTTSTLADTKIFIGNSGALAVAQSVTGMLSLTNAGVANIPLNDGKILIGATNGKTAEQTMSGDATMTRAGVLTIGNNKIGAAEANYNAVSLALGKSTGYNSVAMEPGSVFIGYRQTTGGTNYNAPIIEKTATNSVSDTWVINKPGVVGDGEWEGYEIVFLRP